MSAKQISTSAGQTAGCAPSHAKESGNGHRRDAELAAAAAEAIEWLTTVPAGAIQVTAHEGWLDLEGEVDAPHQRSTVQEVTQHLSGVRGVHNSILVKSAAAPGELAGLYRTAG